MIPPSALNLVLDHKPVGSPFPTEWQEWEILIGKFTGIGRAFAGFLIISLVLIPGVMAAEMGQDPGHRVIITNPGIAPTNGSGINETALENYHKSPEPVTIFEAEVSETALPGPRYMAFGPSVIGISVSPVILSAVIVLVVLGIAAWCIWRYGRNDSEREE